MLAVSLAMSLAVGWAGLAVARVQLDDTVKDVSTLKAQQLPGAVEMQHIKDRLDGVERNQERAAEALERIEHRIGTAR